MSCRRARKAARSTLLRVDLKPGGVARPHIGHRDRAAAGEEGNGDDAVLGALAAKLDGAGARLRDGDPRPMARQGEEPLVAAGGDQDRVAAFGLRVPVPQRQPQQTGFAGLDSLSLPSAHDVWAELYSSTSGEFAEIWQALFGRPGEAMYMCGCRCIRLSTFKDEQR